MKSAEQLPDCSGERRIVFYDGECGLCTNSVKFLLDKDRGRRLQFAPLQGRTAAECLPGELRDTSDLSTMVYLRQQDGETSLLTRSSAVSAALTDLRGFWGFLGRVLRVIPKCIRDPAYRFVANRRHKFFPEGACRLPTEEETKRLLN